MLRQCTKIFKAFDNANIKYCHWKSNEHLLAGLNGDTDLDVLIEKEKHNKINSILMDMGFKRGKTLFYLDYPSIQDFIGFDEATGKMIHLHLHFELMIGKKFIKGINLPWEKVIFETRKKDSETDVYVIDPNIEMILLFIRNYIKLTIYKKMKTKKLSNNDVIEYSWLKNHIDKSSIVNFSKNLFSEELGYNITTYIDNESSKGFKKINRNIKKVLVEKYNYNKFREDIKYYFIKLIAAKNYILHKKLKLPTLYRRGLPEGGVVITFIGVDGSGKSSLIKEVKQWLSWKFDIYNIYFGSGDGSSSLLRLPLKIIAKLRVKKRGDARHYTEADINKKNKNLSIAKAIWALTLAAEKKNKIYSMLKAKNKGMLVLTDRFPQTQIMGFNDGPLLDNWKESKSALKRKMYQYETNIYKLSETFSPSIVFKLKIDKELSAKRKNDTPMYMIEKKIDAINILEFNNSTIIDIDTRGAVEISALQIKQELWKFLSEN
ncbi:MAG: hypothetical protein B6229_00540 [Spirochaetaceae bacterium 4572_7]|nr:MAG: hypothetical protein B6229_00540 [Spirochaetaceae bacterium 4572_7]